MKKIAFIGDVHGKVQKYEKVISFLRKKNIPSIQLGDFGFDTAHRWAENNLLTEKILFGNHDDYKRLNNFYSLGDYGYIEEYSLFYVRGAYSIDKGVRRAYVDWYPEEELNGRQMNAAFDLYAEKKPKYFISHDSSLAIREKMFGITDRSVTAAFIDALFDFHKPKIHIFGHHHVNKVAIVDETTYICLGENEYVILTI